MKKTPQGDIESKFSALQKVEGVLEKKVDGYQSRTSQYNNYDEYRADHNGSFSVTEKIRVADAIKMYKGIASFEKEFHETPSIKAFSATDWEDQIRGQKLLAGNNVKMELYTDIDDGQIMIHNSVNNSHTIVDFKFVFDKDEMAGHIQLSQEGKESFPKLEAALRNQLLQNGNKVGLVNNGKLADHMSVDTHWMTSKLAGLTNGKDIISEVATNTGPSSFKPEDSGLLIPEKQEGTSLSL